MNHRNGMSIAIMTNAGQNLKKKFKIIHFATHLQTLMFQTSPYMSSLIYEVLLS